MCPRVVPTASITLGSLSWAFLSLHWWDFSVPLGGAARLEIEPGQGSCNPGQATGTGRRNTRSGVIGVVVGVGVLVVGVGVGVGLHYCYSCYDHTFALTGSSV